LGKFYQDGIQRGLDADAARYAALGRYYTDPVATGRDQENLLAANPELMVARRYSLAAARAADGARMAANPELISHMRYQTCGC
jgi:sensor domain CHASE-containing protein